MLSRTKEIDVDMEKTKIIEELQFYRKEKKLEIDQELLDYRIEKQKEMHSIAIACAEDSQKYEHDYHSAMETKKTELAKLDADIEARERYIDNQDTSIAERLDSLQEQLKSKVDEIDRLETIIHKLIEREE